jgi:hypothetical protein
MCVWLIRKLSLKAGLPTYQHGVIQVTTGKEEQLL